MAPKEKAKAPNGSKKSQPKPESDEEEVVKEYKTRSRGGGPGKHVLSSLIVRLLQESSKFFVGSHNDDYIGPKVQKIQFT